MMILKKLSNSTQQKIIKMDKQLDTWQLKYEELETKYEQMITPFEVRQTAIVKDQELPFIVKVDPYKRAVTNLELYQQEVKKTKQREILINDEKL